MKIPIFRSLPKSFECAQRVLSMHYNSEAQIVEQLSENQAVDLAIAGLALRVAMADYRADRPCEVGLEYGKKIVHDGQFELGQLALASDDRELIQSITGLS